MKTFISTLLITVFVPSMQSQNSSSEQSDIQHLISTQSETSLSTNIEENTAIKNVTSYYYFPNMQVYFDIDKGVYHYQLNKTWVVAEQLPLYYGGYSLFKNEKVMVTLANDEVPQKHIEEHRKEFPYNPKGRIKRPAQNIVADNTAALN